MDSERYYRNLGTLDCFVEEKLTYWTFCPHDDDPNALTLNVTRDLFLSNDIIGARRVDVPSVV